MGLGLSWRRDGSRRVGDGGGYGIQQRLAVNVFLEEGRGAASQGALAVSGGILPGDDNDWQTDEGFGAVAQIHQPSRRLPNSRP